MAHGVTKSDEEYFGGFFTSQDILTNVYSLVYLKKEVIVAELPDLYTLYYERCPPLKAFGLESWEALLELSSDFVVTTKNNQQVVTLKRKPIKPKRKCLATVSKMQGSLHENHRASEKASARDQVDQASSSNKMNNDRRPRTGGKRSVLEPKVAPKSSTLKITKKLPNQEHSTTTPRYSREQDMEALRLALEDEEDLDFDESAPGRPFESSSDEFEIVPDNSASDAEKSELFAAVKSPVAVKNDGHDIIGPAQSSSSDDDDSEACLSLGPPYSSHVPRTPVYFINKRQTYFRVLSIQRAGDFALEPEDSYMLALVAPNQLHDRKMFCAKAKKFLEKTNFLPATKIKLAGIYLAPALPNRDEFHRVTVVHSDSSRFKCYYLDLGLIRWMAPSDLYWVEDFPEIFNPPCCEIARVSNKGSETNIGRGYKLYQQVEVGLEITFLEYNKEYHIYEAEANALFAK